MTWHIRRWSKDEDLMRYATDGKEWNELDEKHPDFTLEPRNV